MGLEEVKSDILKEAQQKSDEILEEAKQEKEEILEEAEKEAEKTSSKVEREITNEENALEKQELSNARMEAKQEKLSAKQKKLETAFNEFRDSLENLDEDERKLFVENIIEETEFNVSKLQGSEQFKDVIDQTDVEFEVINRPGIVLISNDGSLRRDFTFDRIVENFKSEYRKNVADKLFLEGEQ